MSEPGVISEYLAALAAQLPPGIVDELADGLDLTYQHYLHQGLGTDAAARAALAEFGEPEEIVAAFTSASPARRAARRLLAVSPVAGLCWGMALVADRAWTWPVPLVARALFGAALITVIGLLAVAAFGPRYQAATRSGTAGCAGMAALDATMLTILVVAVPVLVWPLVLAAAVSAARIVFTVQTMRPIMKC